MSRSYRRRWIAMACGGTIVGAPAGAALARLVPYDEPGQSSSSGSGSSTSTSQDPDECTLDDILDCADMGGFVDQRPQGCWCEIHEWVPRRVVNASDGDVGLVPINGGGNEFVSALTEAIGQLHRHSVMFYGDGSFTRHDTMYVWDAEDGSTSDAMGDYVPVRVPVIGAVHFDADALANGLPGAISQTIDDTYSRGRLGSTGLILKPALQVDWTNGGFSEPDRSAFAAAVSAGRSRAGYYKLSDYTDMDSMSRSWNASRVGDLRGSHCAGYVTSLYREQGLSIADVTYPADLRADVAEMLFESVRDACRDETGFWMDLKSILSGHLSACTKLANQVTNCFGDMGCDNTSDDWKDVGSGSTVSPDNLLPDAFKYDGAASYSWDGTLLSSGSGNGMAVIGGKRVSHPGLSGSEPATSATSTSPFQRVEALVYSGGYYAVVDSVRM